ncbi:MAG TPA: hydrogenase maturation protease [Mycobacteriales bacterium]|nr:hydrogenase maturation protease [Mycobacteriales bacterium]
MSATLVVGVGTERGDDAAGLLVVRRLRAAGAGAATAELAGDLTALLELWRPDDRVALVDAVRTGAAPGTVHILDVTTRPLPASIATASTHAISLGDAVELARVLDRLPARIVVYGIEGTCWTDGRPPTGAVAAAVDRVVAELRPG